MLELKREPEVVFWVFVFPLLLALGLGIAFRNKPAEASSVAIVSGAQERRKLRRFCKVLRSMPHSRSTCSAAMQRARVFVSGNTIS